MKTVTISCPSCCGVYSGPLTSKFITCEYCGSRYALDQSELKGMGFTDKDGDGYDDNDVPSKKKAAREREVVPGNAVAPALSYVQEACERLLKNDEIDASAFVSSKKIERGLGIPSGEQIYLIHDDTLFKSGKNGFALTSEGIYCREMGDWKAHSLTWDEFAHGKRPEKDDHYVRQGGTSIAYYTGFEDACDVVFEFFDDLWMHCHGAR